ARRGPFEDVPAHVRHRAPADARPWRAGRLVDRREGAGAREHARDRGGLRAPRRSPAPVGGRGVPHRAAPCEVGGPCAGVGRNERQTSEGPGCVSRSGAVAQLVRVPVCHTGGRGFEPRQPRLNPPRGTTHPAPPATAGGAFVFFGRALTSTYHVPVLADAVREWTTGGCRVVDATVGGGGHAALFRELGAEVLAVDRDPEAIAAARARLGDAGIRYSSGPFGSAKVLGTIETFRPDRIFVDL